MYSLRRLSDMPGNQIAVACLGNDIDIDPNNDNPSLVSFRTNGRRPKGLKSTYVRNLKYGFRDPSSLRSVGMTLTGTFRVNCYIVA